MVFERIWRDPDKFINYGKQWSPFADTLSVNDMNYIVSNLNYVADNISIFEGFDFKAFIEDLKNQIPTKTSQLENDSNFATETYVQENGGKIDSISLNGTEVPIVNKNVDIPIERGATWFLTPNKLASSGQIPLSDLSSTTSETPMVGDFIINNMYDNDVAVIGYIENEVAYYDRVFSLRGEQGEKGNGIRYIRDDGINANGDHEYTIFLDDDTYYVFTAPKGDKGDKGDTGATGANGNSIRLTSASLASTGNVDIVTITTTDKPIVAGDVIIDNDGNVAMIDSIVDGYAYYTRYLNIAKEGVGIGTIVYVRTDENGGNVYRVNKSNGESYEITAPKGDKGDKGDTGESGTNGENGNSVRLTTSHLASSGKVDIATITTTDRPIQVGDILIDNDGGVAMIDSIVDGYAYYFRYFNLLANLSIDTSDFVKTNNETIVFSEEERQKSKNLLYLKSLKTTQHGLDITLNEERQMVTINGTATSGADFLVRLNNAIFGLKEYYYGKQVTFSVTVLSGSVSNTVEFYLTPSIDPYHSGAWENRLVLNAGDTSASATFNISTDKELDNFRFYTTYNTTFDNLIIVLQIEEGDVATEFAYPYGQLTHNNDKLAMFAENERQKSKNLFVVSDASTADGGMNYTADFDKQTITLNGTTSYSYRRFPASGHEVLEAGKTYAISVHFTNAQNIYTYLHFEDDTYEHISVIDKIGTVVFTPSKQKVISHIAFEIYNATFNNEIVKVQLESGNVVTEWQYPYGAIVHEKDVIPDVLYDIDEKPTIGGVAYNDGIKIGTTIYEDFSKYREIIIYSDRNGTMLRTVANVKNFAENHCGSVAVDYGFNYFVIHSFYITKEGVVFLNGGYMYIVWAGEKFASEDSSSSNKIVRIEGVK